jgi:GT2 family glycosyltransferase
MSTPKVAIVVLNFNGEACLPACLRALSLLRYPEYQVIVVDNGSTDTSFMSAQKEFPSFIYEATGKNLGFGGGMNVGMKLALAAGFDLVWLMNYDAEPQPESLSTLVSFYQKNPKEHSVMSPVIETPEGNIWYAGGSINYLRMRTEHQQKVMQVSPYQTHFLTGCSPLLSKEAITRTGFFDERYFLYYEDADLSLRFRSEGYSLWVVPEARVVHEEKSSQNPQKLYYLVHSGLIFFAKHTPRRWQIYQALYVTIRRGVNKIKLYFGLFGAQEVHRAYDDYFRKYSPKNKLYLR